MARRSGCLDTRQSRESPSVVRAIRGSSVAVVAVGVVFDLAADLTGTDHRGVYVHIAPPARIKATTSAQSAGPAIPFAA